MKKGLILLSLLLLSVSLMAQVRTGTIWGHVTDTQGAPLPGVSVSLKSTYSAVLTQVTDAQGIFRFVSLAPSKEYTLTAELQGFKKQEKTGIIVVIGVQSRIDFTMEQGKIEEEVTVVAVTPTVDAKKTMVGKNVTQEILQSLPTSRDPWNVMQMAPGIIMDRENVGGSESGQQAGYYVKGDSSGGANNVWAIDGVVVTDPAAIGAAPIYWDFDSFEEMNIVTGGADVSIQTGGVGLNMVTRRGGNKVSIGGRFYLTDGYFQANNLTASLKAQGVHSVNTINYIKDYGFNVGGPIVKDKAWLWGSYGVQDIFSYTLSGVAQKPTLTDYNAKLNLQLIPSNRFEALLTSGNKTFLGRSSSQSFPEGYNQSAPFHFGDPIIKLQDEQQVGNSLLLTAKYAYSIAAFQLIPGSDPGWVHLAHYDATKDVQYDADDYVTRRPMHDYNFYVNYYNDQIFGASHEFKLGVEYITRKVSTFDAPPGQLWNNYDLNYPDIDWTASGSPGYTPGMQQFELVSAENLYYGVKQLTAFLQDTVTTGRFNFLLGLRYDRQTPSVLASHYKTVDSNPVWSMFDPTIVSALAAFMPGAQVPTINPDYHWNVFSPRIGITYDLFGNGKTVLKLSGSMYGDFMGSGMAGYFNPNGTSSWMYFWWLPSDNTGIVHPGDVYGNDVNTYGPIPLILNGAINPYFISDTYNYQYGGFVPYASGVQPSTWTVNSNATSTRTWELLLTIDHELMPDFSVGLTGTFRRYNHFSWDVGYYTNGYLGNFEINGQSVWLTPANYSSDGTIPSTILNNGTPVSLNLGAGPGHTIYLLNAGIGTTPYAIHTLNNNYETYWGLDLNFNKRLSNKWMFDGSVSYMDQWYHYGDGVQNPQNLWALQDQLYTALMGGSSGKINAYVFSHWLLKLEGLYQLPYDFNISFTFNARAGYVIPRYMGIVDYTWPNSAGRSVTAYLDIFGNLKLPTFYQLNLRLEKMIKLFDTGRIYLMADVFNVTNAATVDRRYDDQLGTYRIYADHTTFTPYAHDYTIYQILNPLIARFGVRFQF